MGFSFKPKYNRLLCLEYILLKTTDRFIEKYDISKKKEKRTVCEYKCPMKLLYKNVKHYHDDNGDIIIDKKNNMFNRLVINNKRSPAFNVMIKSCKSLDQYVKERNWYVGKDVINIYDVNDNKYDVSIN